ncbi:hypothetical protein DACRYDRAFT_74883 [Dacryopinax primogenitus]|uniref:Scamp-domain-containing protein n=1 Tax=Dacryopinax primogenitus (strain DJM 731) TaxID=1858805 RepID=M5GEQ5_DACPD|nr:uncharacterized protein DACRYDRAFT_74883 [Dacryopinax primogenitus]EJU05607.1 hypothetical protein DACRYDRAFT_74883 [Dacryopinax primogenitus]
MSHNDPFASTASLDDDGPNPFADPVTAKPSFPASVASVNSANPDARLEELSRRERELDARERDLGRQEQAFADKGKPNWPFCVPFLHHDIKGDIPEASQQLMQRLYLLWLVLIGTVIINFIGCIFILLSGTADGGKDLGASILYLVVIPPASFFLWYLPIYRGFAKEQSLFYYIYYVFCGFHLLFSVYMIIGIPSTGSAGLIQMISAYARHAIAAGILGTVATVGWVVQGVGNLLYYRLIWKHGNEAGHTFSKAKGELATHGATAYFTGRGL